MTRNVTTPKTHGMISSQYIVHSIIFNDCQLQNWTGSQRIQQKGSEQLLKHYSSDLVLTKDRFKNRIVNIVKQQRTKQCFSHCTQPQAKVAVSQSGYEINHIGTFQSGLSPTTAKVFLALFWSRVSPKCVGLSSENQLIIELKSAHVKQINMTFWNVTMYYHLVLLCVLPQKFNPELVDVQCNSQSHNLCFPGSTLSLAQPWSQNRQCDQH